MAPLLAAAGPALHAQALPAHTHGRATLELSADAAAITLRMEVPLESLVGFERAPRSAAERGRVQTALRRLRTSPTLFRIDPAAKCGPPSVALSAPVLGVSDMPDPDAIPGAASGEGHADLDARFVYACEAAGRARFVDIGLFEAFPAVRTIDARVVSPQGQFGRVLKAGAPRLSWGR